MNKLITIIFENNVYPEETIFLRKEIEKAGKDTHLDIYIGSGGGNVNEGISIYNQIKRKINEGAKINTIISSQASSIASIIALSAKKENRFAQLGVGSLIHEASVFLYFTNVKSSDSKELVQQLNATNEQILEIYLKETNLSRAKLVELMNKETVLVGKKLKEYGFISKIIEATPTNNHDNKGIIYKINSNSKIEINNNNNIMAIWNKKEETKEYKGLTVTALKKGALATFEKDANVTGEYIFENNGSKYNLDVYKGVIAEVHEEEEEDKDKEVKNEEDEKRISVLKADLDTVIGILSNMTEDQKEIVEEVTSLKESNESLKASNEKFIAQIEELNAKANIKTNASVNVGVPEKKAEVVMGRVTQKEILFTEALARQKSKNRNMDDLKALGEKKAERSRTIL